MNDEQTDFRYLVCLGSLKFDRYIVAPDFIMPKKKSYFGLVMLIVGVITFITLLVKELV